MKRVAEDVWQLGGAFPPNAINIYVIGDVLIDAGTRHAGRRILRELKGRTLSAHALTHAHPDHQGASHEVCTKLGLAYWVPSGDADAAEDPSLIGQRQPANAIAQFFARTMTGPGHPVDRRLHEGDEVAGFKVVDAPGHSAGHVVYWRESDRVLIVGDVLTNMDTMTGIPGLQEPKAFLTPDPARNRESIRALRGLEPTLVLFGHGAPLRDTARFERFVSSV
jgi:glyoxylase-like metal-dependent hydrolase (beta-lactamase superfamily II)